MANRTAQVFRPVVRRPEKFALSVRRSFWDILGRRRKRATDSGPLCSFISDTILDALFLLRPIFPRTGRASPLCRPSPGVNAWLFCLTRRGGLKPG